MLRYGMWILGLLFAVAVSYGFLSSPYSDSKTLPKARDILQNAEVAQTDLQVKITPQTDIVQKIKYTKCGDEEITREKATAKVAGMTRQQLQQVYRDWTIETFDIAEVVVSLAVDGYCNTHHDNQFIGIYNDHVAVYYGKPGPKALLKEETDIPISVIHPEDRRELEKGIVVNDRSELLQTLEGLQEHQR